MDKICTKCKEYKSISEFVKDSQSNDNLTRWCIGCREEHRSKYMNKIREQNLINRQNKINPVIHKKLDNYTFITSKVRNYD